MNNQKGFMFRIGYRIKWGTALSVIWVACGFSGLIWADSSPEQDEQEPAKTGFVGDLARRLVPKIYWDNGVHIETASKRLKLKIGGQAQIDSAAFSEEGFETELGQLENGSQWRRARLYADGTFGKRLEFKFQYEFVPTDPPRLKDAWVNFINLPVPLEVTGGRFKAALGLENFARPDDLTFMERGLISAFLPTRNTGLLLHGDSRSYEIRWAFGVLKEEDDFGVEDFNHLTLSGRFTKAFRPADEWLLHTGVDFAHRKVNDKVRFLERPESHIAPDFVDTGEFPANSVNLAVIEGAAVKGPFSIQSEWAKAWVNSDTSQGQEDVDFTGLYVYGSYFLTGETRPYSAEKGCFTRLHPRRTFRDAGGWGALEVAFRFSHLDLNDKNIAGGRLNDFSSALNWYPSHNYRVMFNVIRANQDQIGTTWIYQLRLQAAF